MSSAISRFVPTPRLHEVDRVAVASDPAVTWAAARHVDLYRLPFVRALFAMRTAPDRIAERLHGRRGPPTPRSMRIDDIIATPSRGFRHLDERPGEEVVVGAIGKVWQPRIPFVDVDGADVFVAFNEPGFIKVAWAVQVYPRSGGGSWMGVELRVSGTDDRAWREFASYWRLIGPFSRLIRLRVLRMLARQLGNAPPDAKRLLGADDMLPVPDASWTHAVTIEAPPEHIWPWLAQMGCRRGGWYSIDWLDNGGAPSASRIIPEFQQIRVGDRLPATPNDTGGFAVLRAEPPRLLVLGSPSLSSEARASDKSWGMFGARYDSTWAFVLEPVGDTATRLVVRVRGRVQPGARATLARVALRPIHEVMERTQLRNLKRRAESAPTAGGDALQ
jgi:hypothetical protein